MLVQSLSFTNSSEKLISAVGWSFNKTLGEWISYDNVIEEDNTYNTEYQNLKGEYMKSHSSQNFIGIETKSLTINEKEYCLSIETFGPSVIILDDTLSEFAKNCLLAILNLY